MSQLFSKIGVPVAPGFGIRVLLVALCCVGVVQAQQPNDHIFPAAPSARRFINFDSTGFLINGQHTFLVSAGIEYARVPRALWADRLLRLQRAGFNCVEIYTFWNYHEPQEGVFNFSGDHDLEAFLRLVKGMGMYAIVRVGPYYCAEWDNGGYPLWLKFKPGLRVREPNAAFEKYVGLFFDRLFPIVSANQINRGGSVIMVQLENEHPVGWGTDMPNSYFTFLREKALSLGLEVPYFFSGLHHATDPAAEGRRGNAVAGGGGVAVGNAAAGDSLSLFDPARPNPWFSTEFWSVWYNGYGSGEKEAKLYERRTWKIIAHGGAGYNYYMAHGGSNFGYTNNDEDAASYDYGAAVGQSGDLRPIYYSFKRAALFARSFAEDPGGLGITYLDNPSDTVRKVDMGSGLTVRLDPGEIMPVLKRWPMGSPAFKHVPLLTGHTAKILAQCKQKKWTTLVIYGDAGSRVTLNSTMNGMQQPLTVEVPVGLEPKLYTKTFRLRILVMNKEAADRTWIIGDTIVVGPKYVGEMTVKRGKIQLVTEDTVGALVYTASGVQRLAAQRAAATAGVQAQPMRQPDGRGVLGNWRRQWTTGVTTPEYDASSWKYSEWPLQMGADGDTTADAWYRTTVNVDESGGYTLLVEGSDRATVFVDGQPMGPVNIKEGAIPLTLAKGQHILAVFTAHDGRDKLAAYIGALDSVARKGLFGKALLVKGGPAIKTLTDWRMRRAGAEDWKPYKIGEDAFDKKQDSGWFETVLPDVPTDVRQAELRFASVDENATVFINGRKLLRHEGWNAPFNILLDRLDTMRRPIRLTLFVENYSNEGGIDQAVRFSPYTSPVEVKGWRMRGGMGDSAGRTPGPCWWTTDFTLPANPGYRMVWRVIPEGLGHGSVWVNGHNLGRYPAKTPVNGLYIPECWLQEGKNQLVVFDEDGKEVARVRVEAEMDANQPLILLQ